jgi:hypothetical protein
MADEKKVDKIKRIFQKNAVSQSGTGEKSLPGENRPDVQDHGAVVLEIEEDKEGADKKCREPHEPERQYLGCISEREDEKMEESIPLVIPEPAFCFCFHKKIIITHDPWDL